MINGCSYLGATASTGFTMSLDLSLVTSLVASLVASLDLSLATSADLSFAASDGDFDELQLADKNRVKTKSNNNFFMSLIFKLVDQGSNVQ